MRRTEEAKTSVKKEAFNCVENLLVRDEISIETYQLLNRVIAILSGDSYDLGEGISLRLVDCKDAWDIMRECEVTPCLFFVSVI